MLYHTFFLIMSNEIAKKKENRKGEGGGSASYLLFVKKIGEKSALF